MKQLIRSGIYVYLIVAGIIFVIETFMSYIQIAWGGSFDLNQIAMNIVFSLILALPIGIVYMIVIFFKSKKRAK